MASVNIKCALYCAVWISSILIGFIFLYAPLIPLILINRRVYRKATDNLFAIWEAFNVSLLDIIMGVRIVVTGDKLDVVNGSSLILANHRTRVDWNFLWSVIWHQSVPTSGANAKLVLKDDVKTIPGVGWTMQMSRCIYIARKWKTDEHRIGESIEYLTTDKRPYQIILFPEGTNLTSKTKEKSDEFAAKNNLANYEYVLHPRTTGFACIVQKMSEVRSLDAIYDITIGYPDEVPEDEKTLFEGKFPKEIHFHIKKYPAPSLPNTIIGLEKWLQEVWKEKEESLKQFYKSEQKGFWTGHRGFHHRFQKVLPIQYLALFSWFVFIYHALAYWVCSVNGVLWMVFVSVFMHLTSRYTCGLNELEILADRFGNLNALLSLIWRSKKND